ncbi:O-antigen ligase family protein [Bizionia sp. KMM 8389]
MYLTKPIIAISFGCYLVQRFTDKRLILKVLVLFCLFTSVLHILTLLFYLEGEWDTALIRNVGGKGSELEAFIFSVFIVYLRKAELHLFSKKFNRYFIIIVFTSIALYLSRTTFIAIVIFLLSFYGYTQINRKQVLYLIGVLTFLVTFMVSLQFMDIDRQASGVESFFYKLQMAPAEIFNTEIDTSDHTQLWDGWRAYEAMKGIETMNHDGGAFSYVSGMGLGSLVDLGFEAPLGQENMQYIPHIHNGYVYVLFKSGILGIILLFLWVYTLYTYIYRSAETSEGLIFHRLLSGLGMYLGFSTLVITGIYNMGFVLAVLLGLVIGFKINNDRIFVNKKIA